MEMDLGKMESAQAERVRRALDGKTYMDFRVDLGICPGPFVQVTVCTDYEASEREIFEFALFALATGDEETPKKGDRDGKL